MKRPSGTLLPSLLVLVAVVPAMARHLAETPGRNDDRVLSAPFALTPGMDALAARLPERLERLGYRRVHDRPTTEGQYFWGHDRFRIWRRSFRHGGDRFAPVHLRLEMDRSSGIVTGVFGADGTAVEPPRAALEPTLLAENLDREIWRGATVELASLPEEVWRPLLAIEDHRFFDHHGVDGLAVARALLVNLKRGGVAQGGSTLTQQLVKMRDLSPKRSLGRKASEAVRALAVEAEHTKEEILEAYLSWVYMGHMEGVAVHGWPAAARAYFSSPLGELDLARAAVLAALVQAPNRLSPLRHPERILDRRDLVLDRLRELGWVAPDRVRRTKRSTLGLDPSPPPLPSMRHVLARLADLADRRSPRRRSKERGVVVETTLDPLLQVHVEAEVRRHLDSLRASSLGLQAAVVVMDSDDGRVLAWVGGHPDDAPGGLDRVVQARRHPGSTLKPLVVLEALQDCGGERRLSAATRIDDSPLRIRRPDGPWLPVNDDRRWRGPVTLRRALRDSLNVPLVRVARHCGFDPTARRLRRAGIPLPEDPPPAFVLGAVEVTPLQLAEAYTALAGQGRWVEARLATRLERPSGRRLEKIRPDRHRVAGQEASWLTRHLLEEAARIGTGRRATLEGSAAAVKTGTSSGGRDAWAAGLAEDLVAVVWVGLDRGGSPGLSGGRHAAPLWRQVMELAVASTPGDPPSRPDDLVEAWIDPKSGLRVPADREGAVLELLPAPDRPEAQAGLPAPQRGDSMKPILVALLSISVVPPAADAAGPFAVVLGIAQDGGAPQTACRKPCCADRQPGEHRVASLGLVDPATGRRWVVDATPDFPAQVATLDGEADATATTPVDGVFLTHAHMGHYTGLMHLGREAVGASGVPVWAMPRMASFLAENGPWDQLLRLGNIELMPLEARTPVRVGPFTVTPLPVPHRDEYSETVGFVVQGPERSLLWLPDIDKWERWTTPVEEVLGKVDVAYLDATFFSGDELGRDMSEIPHPFILESLARFQELPATERAKVRFVHLNHTNPCLESDSDCRQRVEAAGMAVARTGEVEPL